MTENSTILFIFIDEIHTNFDQINSSIFGLNFKVYYIKWRHPFCENL